SMRPNPMPRPIRGYGRRLSSWVSQRRRSDRRRPGWQSYRDRRNTIALRRHTPGVTPLIPHWWPVPASLWGVITIGLQTRVVTRTAMPERQSRRLAAILAADIAGYSALMGADEARTVRDLKEHQAVVLPMVGEFGGRIIDTAGDGILAEFPSVVNAVQC